MPRPAVAKSAETNLDTWRLYQNVFNDDLRARNLSPRTVEAYGNAISQLGAFLRSRGQEANPETVTPEDVRAFIAMLVERHAAATAHNRFRGLNAYFNWLEENEYIAGSPMKKLKPPKLDEKVVPVIDGSDIERLLKTVAGRDFESRRDRAIISVFIDTGMRLSEMAGIRVSQDPAENDVDQQYGQIRVVGKGRVERIVSIGAKTRSDLNHYLLARAKEPGAVSPYLWLGRRGRMTQDGIYQMIKRRANQAGMPEIHPHQFRHTFANEWLANEGNETDLMRLTGWRSRTMLQRYGASAGTQRALQAHKRNSPRDRLG
ncbi:MAG: tyrosine-type recombinase/integrase [Dehalococcoidia bacterium]|nr:tyrosine-type recombinase/integrase [Dehalococcoidia bacterium]